MTAKKIVLGIVLMDFAALNAWVVYRLGYLGFWEQALGSLGGIAVMVDLAIALGLVLSWMWADARQRGIGLTPYVVLTALFGSIGPLLYLLRRPEEATAAQPLARAVAARS